jgi:hypothetical protein
MSSNTISEEREKQFIAGDDGRARLFFQNFVAGDFVTSVNEGNAVDIVKDNRLAGEIMKTGSYESYAKEQGMSHDDVHYEFTDFVVNTALFHRSIDQSTLSGTVKGNLVVSLEQQIRNWLAAAPQAGQPFGIVNTYGNLTPAAVPALNNQHLNTFVPNGFNAKWKDQHHYWLVLLLCAAYHVIKVGNPAADAKSLATAVPNGINTVGLGLQQNLESVLDLMAGTHACPNPQARDGFACAIKHLLAANPPASYATLLGKLGAQQNQFVADLDSKVNSTVKTAFKVYAVDVLSRIENLYNGNRGVTQLMNALLNNHDDVFTSFEQRVVNAYNGAMADTISRHFSAHHTTLSGSNGAKKLWENVYRKWSSLRDSSRKMYEAHMTLQTLVNGQWEQVAERNYQNDIPDAQLSNYRLNLTKVSVGSGAPRFQRVLPKYAPTVFTGVWFTNAQSQRQKVTPNTESFFRDLYYEIYLNGTSVVLANLPRDFASVVVLDKFTLLTDRLVKNRLLWIKNRKSQSSQSIESDETYISFEDKNYWKRDGTNGKLYIVDENGNKKYYEMTKEDPETALKLKSSFKCYSSLVNDNGDIKKCDEYMNQCILDNNATGLGKCLDYINANDKSFFDVARSEIKQMHPLVALRTLQRFGFRVREAYDRECKMNIKKVEAVKHWLANFMKTKFKDASDQSAIEQNSKLLEYLELIVQYVNGNPTILNGDRFTGKTEESVGTIQQSDLAKKLNIPTRKAPNQLTSGLLDGARLRVNVAGNLLGATSKFPRFSISLQNGSLTNNLGNMFNNGFVLNGGAQVGGAEDRTIHGSAALNALMNQTLSQLTNRGKKLVDADVKSIESKLRQMADMENKLQETADYLVAYNDLMVQLRDYKSEVLTIDTLKALVDKYNGLSTKYSNEEASMASIFEVLQKLVAGINTDQATELKGYEEIKMDTV